MMYKKIVITEKLHAIVLAQNRSYKMSTLHHQTRETIVPENCKKNFFKK